jgi:hypothetical protein
MSKAPIPCHLGSAPLGAMPDPLDVPIPSHTLHAVLERYPHRRACVRAVALTVSGRMFRAAAGAAVLVLWCVAQEFGMAHGNLWAIREAAAGGLRDSIATNQARFQAIRRDLPADRPVGYVSDIPRSIVDDRFETALVRAQSALAPHLVLDTDTLTPIVGNFPDGVPDSAWLAGMGLRKRHDYGRGVLLLTRSVP